MLPDYVKKYNYELLKSNKPIETTEYVYISMGIKWDEPQDLNNTLKFPIGLPVFN